MTIREALQNLVYLHACEQEGVESGQPTPEQWFKAVEDAEEALRKEQEQEQENISSWSALTNLDYLRCNNGSLTGDISSWPAFVIDAVQRAISESIIEYISQHLTEQPSIELSDEEYRTMLFERSQLFMPYGVKDKEGKFRDVVDVQTVIEIFKEQHTSPKPNK